MPFYEIYYSSVLRIQNHFMESNYKYPKIHVTPNINLRGIKG